ncbi:MAG: heme o synthase [Gammaproteobacteria bacterium]|nr:heme o synthase [Gammaproteobacteria bacterium]
MTTPATPLWRDYVQLCKPKVVVMLVFTAVVGMFLATPGLVPLDALVFGTIGIGLASAAGAAFNQIIDARIDELMDRTQRRPLPGRRVTRQNAWLFAWCLCIAGTMLLAATVNVLTAFLTLASMVGYSVIYTVYLKRATPQNIVIGGAAGAMPPVLGWTSVTGALDPHALLLFLIIFAWTPPHFWALAIHRREEYAKADIPMLPVTHGEAYTKLQVIYYTIILAIVSLLPFITGMSGLAYLFAALVLDAGFLYQAWLLYAGRDGTRPMKVFAFSIYYLAALFAALLIDHYLL